MTSVGKKFVMALTGLALTFFVITHLAGNLQLFLPQGEAFNRYAEGLASLGPILYAAEVGLLAFIIFHAVSGILLKLDHAAARGPVGYSRFKSKGKPSRHSTSTRSMIITGVVLLVFIILHIAQFKFGPGVAEGYVATVDGKEVRDLHRLVVETFRQPIWAVSYMGVMVLLGLHLRHGFWSAFQSLGMMNPRLSGVISLVGVVLALLLAVGFLGIPLWILVDPMGVYG